MYNSVALSTFTCLGNTWSEPEKDEYQMIPLMCGIEKYDTNEHIYKIEMGSQT